MHRRTILGATTALAMAGGLTLANPGVSQAAAFTVTSTADTLDPGTLRSAIVAANANGEADVITLGSAQTYVLSLGAADEEAAAEGDLDVTSDITIVGNGSTIDANDLDRIFEVKPGASLTLSGIRLTDGSVAGAAPLANSGGLVLNQGTLDITSSDLTNGTATRAGGAIEATAGSSTSLDDVAVTGNTAGSTPGNGGGFHITGAGTVTISDSLVSGNSATNEGGGLWNSSAATMTVTDTIVSGNTVTGTVGTTALNGGGGVFQQGGGTVDVPTAATGTLTIDGGAITGNSAIGNAMASGGGVLNIRGTVDITGTDISDNRSSRAGGGIEINGAGAPTTSTALADVRLADNTTGTSPGNGGGLHITGPGTTTITGSEVTGNSATNEGGGVWNSSAATMTISDTEISDNTVTVGATLFNGGGGVFQQGGGTNDAPVAATGSLSIEGGSITGNQAVGSGPSSGGGVLNVRGDVTITGTLIAGNEASRAGGGIEANGNAVDAANTTLVGVTLAANTVGASPGNGGGFHLTGPGATTVTETTVVDNVAANEGGGLWNSAVGTMTVDRSLIAGNVANGDGDLGDDEGGGGLFNDGGTLTVNDSTVSGNSAPNGAGGGVLDVNGTITLSGVTVTDNAAPTGAGVFGFTNDGGDTVVFGGSIIAGNDGDDCGGSLQSEGGNVLGAGCADGPDDTVTADPQLGALADNGGATNTHLPAPGSPAIDNGLADGCSEVDQRGVARPVDGDGDGTAVCDAGAVEAAFVATPTTPTAPTAPTAPPATPVTADPTFVG